MIMFSGCAFLWAWVEYWTSLNCTGCERGHPCEKNVQIVDG